VFRVLADGDFPKPPDPFFLLPVPPLATRHLPLQDKVIVYHGQPVAMVVAETLEAAEEAAAEVRVEIQMEPPTNPERARPETPEAAGYGALASLELRVADVDAAVRESPVVVAETYKQPSRHNNPMEPSAILAVWENDQLTVHDSVQHVYAVQTAIAAAFDIEPTAVRVVSPYTGGGFGAKAFVWPHEILAAMAARILDKPIKLVLTRAQMYSIVGYQPSMTHDVALAAEAGGKLTGVRHDVTNVTAKTDDYVEFGSVTAGALYRSPAISTSQRVRRGHVNLPTFMRSPIDGPARGRLARRLTSWPEPREPIPSICAYSTMQTSSRPRESHGRPSDWCRLTERVPADLAGEAVRRAAHGRATGQSAADWPTRRRGNIASPLKLD
jgi:xanthine dehydrogenase YagR molybdenum-binding subunit